MRLIKSLWRASWLARQETPGADDADQVLHRLVEFIVNNNILKLTYVADFLARAGNPAGDHVGRVLRALVQPANQGFERRRQDENADRIRHHFADLGRALPVDLEQDVGARGALVVDPGLGRAVVIAVHQGAFEKGARRRHFLEFLLAHEMIFAAVDFAGARLARRVRHR